MQGFRRKSSMLSLLFKEPLTEEQEEELFFEFKEFAQKYEHNITDDIDTKLSVYLGDTDVAQQKLDEMRSRGYKFIGQVHHGKPFFLDKFVNVAGEDEMSDAQENSENVPQLQKRLLPVTPVLERMLQVSPILERKPIIKKPMSPFMVEPVAQPQLPSQQYVTVQQFEELSKKAEDQLNEFSINLMSKVEALSASAALTIRTAFVHDHATYASNMGQSSSSAVTSPQSDQKPTPMTIQYKAKNELIANGIRCEKCGKTVRDVEPITKLIMTVREHVMTHFDSENPHLKRFGCRECPDFQTNFVDDFEKHLRKHGSMSSLPEKRQKLTVSLLTTTHLELIAKLSDTCFPEVFEKEPPEISTILAVDTPVRAKVSIFPRLDRLYASKYNIPYVCNTHGPLPAAVVKID